ncbi:HEWD family protein [Halolamina rubra]|uniref:HEWD family protein n=1 Tax=Halolamina rubra TaxID=1380430 RepID=UPI0006799450|nr:HEWD family protein [Halolamina rubra]
MSDLLRTPERRTCERCGRVEQYDEGVWRADRLGDLYCIHEWDIDGAFVPVKGEATPAAEEC